MSNREPQTMKDQMYAVTIHTIGNHKVKTNGITLEIINYMRSQIDQGKTFHLLASQGFIFNPAHVVFIQCEIEES